MSLDELDALLNWYDRVVNRRGHVVRIVAKHFTPCVTPCMPGGNKQSYEQRVEGGRPWTLRGCV